ncbi:lysophosphatidylserine lipase ABHD12 isoform X2 [Lycorma delicatula]|uniref:lysophosphatidylserine lipase ABHD12 isoform X2 n=1 Tax=Lycorma delicatula TaxID=130591 RepID=UPI003F50E184
MCDIKTLISLFVAVGFIATIPVSIVLWFYNLILFGTLVFVIVIFCLVFVAVPLVFRYSYSFQCSLLFLNFVNNLTNLKYPDKYGVLGARNLYLESENDIKLGTWHILPLSKLPDLLLQHLSQSGTVDEIYDRYLGSGDPIFIYFHGNAGNRAAAHRIELYKLLQKNNYHVVAADYRSYGDSSSVAPDEDGVVTDAKAVYSWVKNHAPQSDIFIWGHSLGTGISSHAVLELESEGSHITGLVLEAPFTNLQDEIRDYPIAQLFRPLPWFDFFFVDPTYNNNFRFSSDIYLMNVTAPLLILHAEDDKVVPHHLGKKLYEKIKNHRRSETVNTIKLVSFDKNRRLGHQNIYLDTTLPHIISNFVSAAKGKKDL